MVVPAKDAGAVGQRRQGLVGPFVMSRKRHSIAPANVWQVGKAPGAKAGK
jgi:hypothetical protein